MPVYNLLVSVGIGSLLGLAIVAELALAAATVYGIWSRRARWLLQSIPEPLQSAVCPTCRISHQAKPQHIAHHQCSGDRRRESERRCWQDHPAINLGAALAELGHEILLIDFDPQANSTSGLGLDPPGAQHDLPAAGRRGRSS